MLRRKSINIYWWARLNRKDFHLQYNSNNLKFHPQPIHLFIKWRTIAYFIQIRVTYNYSSYATVDRTGEENRIRTKSKTH